VRSRLPMAFVCLLTMAANADAPVGATDMIAVPGGPFTMGADSGGQDDEHPAHTVTLPPFRLDRTEVTNGAYQRCVDAKVCRPHDSTSAKKNHFPDDETFRGPEQPVSSVSWDDAKAYCSWAGKRLPTEAEWEKAARSADGRKYPWGNTPPVAEFAVFGVQRTANVGTHPKGNGPYGHADLGGNVWEWVEDQYDPYAYRRNGADRGIPGSCDEILAAQNEIRQSGRQGFTGSNPIPTSCERVLRGGAFNYDGGGLRAANRVHHPGNFRMIMSGFRCAKDAADLPGR
jgi:formylglycine-generating enzyme required for sulfatase activity